MPEFILAMAQMRVTGGERDQNLERAVTFIEQAASRGAACVVLPEALDLGWTHPSAGSLAGRIPDGWACQRLVAAAKTHRVFVCAGLTELETARIYNSAVLIGPDGSILLHHRKLNELEIGHSVYAQGDRLSVVETGLGTIGLMICADAFARGQVVTRTLGLMGADLILSPCAWAVPPGYDPAREPYGGLWVENYGPVARDYRLWIAGVSNVGALEAGPWAGFSCIGNSLILNPEGAVVATGPFGATAESLLLVKVETLPRPARGDGWESWWKSPGK